MVDLIETHRGGDLEDTDGEATSYRIESDGKKVGFMSVKRWADGTSLIERIDIDDNEQGKGYGTSAIEQIAQSERECYIVPDNARAASLYERLGRETVKDPWSYLDQGFGVYEL